MGASRPSTSWTAQSEAFGLWIDDANGVNGESFLSGGYLASVREGGWARRYLGPPRIDGAIRPGGGGWSRGGGRA